MTAESEVTAASGGAQATRDPGLLALMPDDVRALVQASCVGVSFGFGETIVAEGDPADALFMITAGAVRVVKATEAGGEVPLTVLHAGDVFGETALVAHGKRTATVRATGPVEAMRLDRVVFDALVLANPAVREWATIRARRHELSDFLRLSSVFAGLPGAAVARLVDVVDTIEVQSGEVLVTQGEHGGPMFVVSQGRLAATRAEGSNEVTVGVLRRGDVFGERSVLLGESRPASVRALTDCALLRLDASSLQEVMDEHPDIRHMLEQRSARDAFSALAHIPLDFADALLLDDDGARQLSEVQEALSEPAVAGAELAEDQSEDASARRRQIRRFPVVWQVDEMDCGAACVTAICRYFGRNVPLTSVRDAVGTGLDGTSLRGLVNGAHRLGLDAKPLKASKSRLDSLPLPTICHWKGNHWLVLYALTARHAVVSDPAVGARRIPRTEWDEQWSGYCCVVGRTPALDEVPESHRTWKWLRPFVRPYRGQLSVGAVLALVGAGLEMTIPVIAGKIVDSAIAGDRSQVNLLALAALGLLMLAVGASLVQRWLLARIAVRFDAATLDHITQRMLALPASYFASRRTGDIERRLAGMRQVRVYLVQEGLIGLTSLTQIVVAIVLMLALSPPLLAVYLATVPLYGLAMVYSRRRLRPILASLEEAFGRYQSRQIDAIKGIETVKARGAESALQRALRGQFLSLADRVYRSDLAFMRYDAAVGLVTFLTLAVTVWVGGLLVVGGSLTVGTLVAFNGLVVLANGPIGAFLRVWDQLQYATVLLDRLDDVLEQEPEQGGDHSHLRPVPTLGGRVSIRGLTVRIGEQTPTTILDDVTIEAYPGETIAIVGRSGAGKTTLVRCLSGLVTPTSGRILYDDVDLATLDHRELRSRIGFVLQDDHLFDDTIAGNIALGDAQPNAERVRWAARVADAAEFIERLPLSYDTHVGESGLRLSGGQVQRIAIARAVYRQPPVLILDEATSSLDNESERAVKDSIRSLLEGRTAFVIAHRLSTIRDATRIVVLERGRVAEHGTHDELLERRGIYWHLAGRGLQQ